MKIAVGSDHRGFAVKSHILALLRQRQCDVVDLGTHTEDNCDYPDVAFAVARLISTGQAERGVLICGTGIGMSIAANKVAGVRAAPVHDDITAELSRQHNDCNILCLSSDLIGQRMIDRIIDIWLATPFDGGRHARRVEKIHAYERGPN